MQEITRGEHSIDLAGKILHRHGHRLSFLVTGEHLRAFRPGGMEVAGHTIRKGPVVTTQMVDEAFEQFCNSGATALVAVGGGSVIDLAKGVIFRCKERERTPPFFLAVPTTVGSGSEATQFAVVYNDGRKFSWVDPLLLPPHVILDPTLVYDLPAYPTATSGMDALAQGVESFWGLHATPESLNYATEAITTWNMNFLEAVNGNKMARANMLAAAHFSGKAINITRTTGPHALSYYLTSRHGVAHGHAVGLLLPLFFLYNEPGAPLLSLFNVNDVAGAADLLRNKMKMAGLATTFRELDIDKHKVVDELLDDVNEERFANNPAPYSREKLKQLIIAYC